MRARRAGALAALAGLLLLAAEVASAQQVLISNIGQTPNTAQIGTDFDNWNAQTFTTGSASGGYTLTSIDIRMPSGWMGLGFTVRVFSTDPTGTPAGIPDAELYEMLPPLAPADDAINTFIAPAGTTLAASTRYAVLISSATQDDIDLPFTGSNAADTQANGWTFHSGRFYSPNSGGMWNGPHVTNFLYRIKGSPAGTNNAPQLVRLPEDQSILVGPPEDQAIDTTRTLNYQFPAFIDPEDGALTYTAMQADGAALPAWLTFTPATRTFSGRPAADDAGALSVQVTATDDDANPLSASVTFSIRVVPYNNQPPAVATPPTPPELTEGAQFAWVFPATVFSDPEGDALTYAATLYDGSALPDWLMFAPDTRTFSGTPDSDSAGAVVVKITASDIYVASESTFFTFRVAPSDDPDDPGPLELHAADLSRPANALITGIVLEEAVGGAPPYSYTLAGLPAGLSFNAATRTISGTPSTAGVSTVTYTVTDSASSPETVMREFTFTVTAALAVTAPSNISATAGVALTPVTLPAASGGSSPYAYAISQVAMRTCINVSDPSCDTNRDGVGDVTETVNIGPPGHLGIRFNPETRSLSGTPNDLAADASPITIAYIATDDSGSMASQTFVITVAPDTDSAAPMFLSATVRGGRLPLGPPPGIDGAILTLNYNEPLDPDSTPDGSAFAVVVAGGTPVQPYSVEVAASSVRLILTDPVAAGDAVTLSYTPPDENNFPISDEAGNPAAALANVTATNTTSPPLVLPDPMDITATQDMAITSVTLPVATGGASPYTYSVTGLPAGITASDATPPALSGVPTAVGASTVTYTVTDAASATASQDFTITVSSDAPMLTSATVDGAGLALTYNEPLDDQSVPSHLAFEVEVNGNTTVVSVSGVAISGSEVTLTLDGRIRAGQTVTLTYAAPAANPLRDAAGNPADGFADEAVTNETPPMLSTAMVRGATLTLTYDAALHAASAPAASAFTVTVGGTDQSDPTDVAISGADVILTLAAAVLVGEAVTVSYAVPSGAGANPIQAASGIPAAGFSGETVTVPSAANLGISDVTVDEDAGTAAFTATLELALSTATTLAWYASGGTAIAGSDYAAALTSAPTVGSPAPAAHQFTIPARAASATFSVTINDDDLFERPTETFNVTVTGVDGALPAGVAVASAGDNTATATITDDETLRIGFVDTLIVVSESFGGSNEIYSVTVEAAGNIAPDYEIEIAMDSRAGSAAGNDVDYFTLERVERFTSTTRRITRTGQVVADGVDEDDEDFFVDLSSLPRLIGDDPIDDRIAYEPSTARVIILGTNPYNLSVADITVSEDAGPATVSVTLDRARLVPTELAWYTTETTTGSGDAAASEDFTSGLTAAPTAGSPAPTAHQFTIPADTAAATFDVAIINDDALEPDPETFNVTVTGVEGALPEGIALASAGDATAVVTITDDDGNAPPIVANEIPDQSATAGAAFNYTVPDDAFSDPDGDPLTYSAELADGNALPSWLGFTPGNRTFSGTPAASDVGALSVEVTADDGAGGMASDTFDITVAAATDPGPTDPGPTNPVPTNPVPTNPGPVIPPPPARTLTVSAQTITLAGGASATWTVALGSQPTGDVTVTPVSADASIATVAPETLAFTASNWNTPRTVIVTGVDDGIAGGADRVTTVGHNATGGGYNLALANEVTVTVTDGATTVGAESDELPTDVALSQNYPNPFNPRTTIEYALPQAGDVRLVAYDMLGQEIAVLQDGWQPAGRHAARFHADRLPNGAYAYRLTVDGKAITRTMTLAK